VMLFNPLGHDWWNYIYALHQPLGSFLVAGLASLFFENEKKTFLFFGLGILTHFALDLLLLQVSGGIYLLYPLSWMAFHLDVVANDDYLITLVALIMALVVYMVGRWLEGKDT